MSAHIYTVLVIVVVFLVIVIEPKAIFEPLNMSSNDRSSKTNRKSNLILLVVVGRALGSSSRS